MGWFIFSIVVIVIIIVLQGKKKSSSTDFNKQKKYIYSPHEEDKKYKDMRVSEYIEENKHLTYEEIDAKIERGRKADYDDYTEENKLEFRALKILQEKIRTDNFRNFFTEKEYLMKNISSQELNYRLNQIKFYVQTYKMESIPKDIINEAKEVAEEIKFEEYKNNFTSKSILQLKNYMQKRTDDSIPPKILEYYQYRIDHEEEEYLLIKETTRLKNNLRQQSKAGNFDKVKEYEVLLTEKEKELDDFRKYFFN